MFLVSFKIIFSFFSLRFLVELLYNKHIARGLLNLGAQTTKILDKGSIERIGPYGLGKLLFNLSNFLSKLDTGVVTSYALYILIGLISYMFIIYSVNDMHLFMIIVYVLVSYLYYTTYK